MKPRTWISRVRVALMGVTLVAGLLTACDEDKKPAAPDAAAAAATTSAAPEPPAPARMPEVTLGQKSVQVGMDALQLDVPSFDTAFQAILKKYPIETPEFVVFNVDRKVPTPLATKLTYSLFDAGAKSIDVHTKPRGTFPGTLRLSTDKHLGKLLPCTFVGTITDNLGVAFWSIQGGTAKRYTKGMAGPDLSALHEVFQKEEAGCASTVFFFSADDSIEWGHAYDLATSVVAHDPKYKITQIVLLRQSPVAGKPVKVPE